MRTMEKGYQVKVNITTGIEDYKNAFLAIYNNYKSDYRLLHFENDYDNGIYVTCDDDIVESVVNWLEQFGEVSKERVYIKSIVPRISDKEWEQADIDELEIICVLDE